MAGFFPISVWYGEGKARAPMVVMKLFTPRNYREYEKEGGLFKSPKRNVAIA